jgi:hypothetical protein
MRAIGTGLVLSLLLAAPAVAQKPPGKMTTWNTEQMHAVLQDAGYLIVKEGMSGADIMFIAQPPNHGVPVNIFGDGCTTTASKTACTKAEVRSAFKLADPNGGAAATAAVNIPGLEDFAKNGSIHVRQFIDFTPGITGDDLKNKLGAYQVAAQAALKAIEDGGMLAPN